MHTDQRIKVYLTREFSRTHTHTRAHCYASVTHPYRVILRQALS